MEPPPNHHTTVPRTSKIAHHTPTHTIFTDGIPFIAIGESTQRGLDALDILNVSQEILTRDYDVSDPARLLQILEAAINACRDVILTGQDSGVLDTVFESALLAEYGETRTEEEK
jgi:hypothetical protein